MFNFFQPRMQSKYEVPGAIFYINVKEEPSSETIIAIMMQMGADSSLILRTPIFQDSTNAMKESLENEQNQKEDNNFIKIVSYDTISNLVMGQKNENLESDRDKNIDKKLYDALIEYFNQNILSCVKTGSICIVINDEEEFEIESLKVIQEDAIRVAKYKAKKLIKKYKNKD